MIDFLKKNKYVFFVVVLVLIMLVLAVLTRSKNQENSTAGVNQGVELLGDYKVLEKSEGRFIENKEANLTFKIPDNWVAKDYGSKIGFFNSETNTQGNCSIIVGVKKYVSGKNGAEDLASLIKNLEVGEKKDYYGVVSVAGQKALKTIIKKEDGTIYVSVDLPLENNIYSFSTGLVFSEKCLEELDNFLKTVEIK